MGKSYDYHPYSEDLYHKVIVLKTDETIFCAMEKDVVNFIEERSLTLIEPMVIKTERNTSTYETFQYLNPWMPLSDSDEYVLGPEMVKTVGNMSEQIKDQYIRSVTKLINIKIDYRYQIEQKQKQKEIESKVIDFLKEESVGGSVSFVDEE